MLRNHIEVIAREKKCLFTVILQAYERLHKRNEPDTYVLHRLGAGGPKKAFQRRPLRLFFQAT